SRYLADVLVRNPEFIDVLSDSTLLDTARSRLSMAEELSGTCEPFPTPAAQLDAVRRFRRREILRIGTSDLCGMTDLRQTTQQLASLSDGVVGQCLRIVAEGNDSHGLVVLALGKLGGDELNYSSDIDLVFVALSGAQLEAAVGLARALTHALSDATGEGFLYRVGLRLRPYGGAGALVVSTKALEESLASAAHPAERQAMLKTRPIAGDIQAGEALLHALRPVLFRDAAAARGLVRELKARIERKLTE